MINYKGKKIDKGNYYITLQAVYKFKCNNIIMLIIVNYN